MRAAPRREEERGNPDQPGQARLRNLDLIQSTGLSVTKE
jgi:hypothetical protein